MIEQQTLRRLPAARRLQVMIGQEEAWRQIQDAISPGDSSFQVVLVRAEGGMGKTRILERVVEACGRAVDPLDDPLLAHNREEELTDPVTANIIDVINTQLHDSYQFVVALYQSLRQYPDLRFSQFDTANDYVKQLTALGALQKTLARAQQEATDQFIADLKEITKERRIVFLVDTVERLSYATTEWLLTEGLLTGQDLRVRTHHWLRDFITRSGLENITLLLAGRGREGRAFFERIEATVDAAALEGVNCRLVPVELKPLNMDQTRLYLAQLADDYAQAGPEYRAIAESFSWAADAAGDRYKVISLFTNGVPVRLALYAQVIAEGKRIPAALKMSYREAESRAELLSEQLQQLLAEGELPKVSPPRLRQIQWEVEEEFINLLFRSPTDRRAAVLRALVCAPRGLTAEQLHFVLDAPEGQGAQGWAELYSDREQRHQLEKLVALIQELAGDYLVKRRASWKELRPILKEHVPGSATLRVGLQDEIYRIYAEHMGLFADPVSEETELIRRHAQSTEEMAGRYRQNWEDEKEVRAALYRKLADYADDQLKFYTAMKGKLLQQDEAALEQGFKLEAPATYQFPELDLDAIDDRRALHTALNVFAIERMVYRLLLDPQRNLNDDYLTITPDMQNQTVTGQDQDFWAQAELWWLLDDPWLMKFAPLEDRRRARERGETPLQVLRRVAEQENVTRWIRRFLARGQYDRAAEFGQKVEAVIQSWPRGEYGSPEENEWTSWNHTLAREERTAWVQVASIRRGVEVGNAITRLDTSIARLAKLYETDAITVAFNDRGFDEKGFKAAREVPQDSQEDSREHPGYGRLRQLLAQVHNSLGFSYRTLGQMGKAAKNYREALYYLREDRVERDEMIAVRGKVLNNLSRVLSELGWNSLGMCLDGRNLRLLVAEEVPLAGSYNTLALIYDDMGRYEDAPLLSAKAIAYCRRANEQRQLALSLRQMAESLRHIAERQRTGQRASGTQALFKAAEQLLREARGIFEQLEETERLIEVDLELGSLDRDRMQPDPGKERPRAWERYYEEARHRLNTVVREAGRHNMQQHLLDARINQVRIHYYAGALDQAEAVLKMIETDPIYGQHIITETNEPDAENPELRNLNWVFRHLSTAQMVRGWMASDRFEARVRILKDQDKQATPSGRQAQVKADRVAQDALRDMAMAYALGVAYAELYSPRSRSIGGLQNDLYGRMKKFNRSELDAFRRYLQGAKERYPLLGSISLLDKFIDDFFGSFASMS